MALKWGFRGCFVVQWKGNGSIWKANGSFCARIKKKMEGKWNQNGSLVQFN